MQISCPRCAIRFSLEDAVEDDNGRALMALLGKRGPIARELVAYLGLFRPRTQALRWSRALALAEDIDQMATEYGEQALAQALRETVDAMRQKMGPGWKPLTSHGYLKRVLDTVASRQNELAKLPQTTVQQTFAAKSKSAKAIELLAAYPAPAGIPDWFVRTVCGSLAELITMSVEGVPAYDTLPLVIERWLGELWPKRRWKKDCRFLGAKRLRAAFIQAAEHRGRWPTTKDVLECVPRA